MIELDQDKCTDPQGGVFSSFGLIALGFGAAVGIGWLLLAGTWISDAGTLGAALAFMVGGVAMTIIALNYAEIGRGNPVPGGEMGYAQLLYGQTAARITGQLLLLVFIATASFEAISVPWILAEMAGSREWPDLYFAFGQQVNGFDVLVGIAGTTIFMATTAKGARASTFLQNVMTATFLGASLLFIIAGTGRLSYEGLLENAWPNRATGGAVDGFLKVLMVTPFFFAGFNCIPQALSESKVSAVRKLPAIMAVCVLACAAFYVAIIVATSAVLDPHDFARSDLVVARAFENAFNSKLLSDVVLFSGLLGLLTTWNAVFYASTHLMMAMADRGYLPAFLSGRKRSAGPITANASAATALISSAAIFGGRGMVEPIVSTCSAAISAVFAIVCSGLFIRYLRNPSMHSSIAHRHRDLLVSAMGTVVSLSIFAVAVVSQYRLRDQVVPTEWLILSIWILLGIAVTPRATKNQVSG